MNCARLAIAALVASAAAGCALSYDRSATRLEPTDGGFLYHAYANLRHPLDDPRAEARRLAALTESLSASGLCPDGYGLVGRTATLRGTETDLAFYDVRYRGICK